MSKNLLVNGKAVPASTKSTLIIEEFLMEYYCFRQNILNGKVEFSTKMNNGEFGPFETLTQRSLNTIILRAKEDAGDEMKNPQADIKLYVTSDLVPKFDWLQMDTLHANEVVPTFIGAQGCGKTTFLRRLLPEHLRQYYLDHLNLSNKFDKEMALTNNLLVNLDELEAIRPSQQASLKQTLSKNKVNGRPIFGCVQEDRARYASFVSTTNNPHPLTDATGSRRYICMQIPDGKFIDNDGDINYEQLYAQVLYELRELNAPYWFDNDEVARIQDLNQNYLEQKDMACLVEACFRKPEEDEHAETMNSTEMLKVIRHAYPSLVINRTAKVNLKATMKELNFDIVSHAHVDYYKVVPKKSA